MTAKFGFQVTVQDRTIWIFPEDIDAAELAAQAEAALRQKVAEELAKEVLKTEEQLNDVIKNLDQTVKVKVNKAMGNLPEDSGIEAKVKVLVSQASISDIKDSIGSLTDVVKNEIEALKAKASNGITYGWTRGAGEDPISLGTFDDLLGFIDDKIIGNLPKVVRPSFDVTDSFDKLVAGLPEPVNDAVEALKSGAVFELDGLRLKIPGKGSDEKTQFEIAMLINLVALGLELGPFQLNRLYAKLGNFGPSATAAN